MPGSIQVSVLGIDGVQTTSGSSDTSVKVSMGKREYQTSGTGDFSFPLTTLREKLIVSLVDANGNDVSHTEMETRSIIEKGFLEEKLSLEGGGNVHLRLQFVLSEEDRNRIRAVRQSALRKKHEELVNGSARKLKSVASGSFLSNSQAVSDLGKSRKNMAADEQTIADGEPGTPCASNHMTQQPDMTQNRSSSSEFSSSREFSEVRTSETASSNGENLGLSRLETNEDEELGKRSELEKKLSNVKKMISTFETGLTQDKKLWTAEIQTGSLSDEVSKNNVKIGLQRYWNKSNERQIGSEDMHHSVYTKKADEFDDKTTVSGRMEDKIMERNSGSNKQRRWRSSVSERRDGRGVSLNDSNRTHRVSSNKSNNLVYNKDSQYLNVQGSRLWIFPDGAKGSCITTSGARHMIPAEGAAYRRKIDSYVRENIGKNHFQRGSGDGSKTNTDSRNSRGPVGQMTRAVIMVGFATLVLLTRQRNQR